MKFFTGEDFKLNNNITFTSENINGRLVVYADNIYENPDRVVDYFDSCPILTH